jgi:hypothetical protein
MSRACSCCTRLFDDADLAQRQDTKGYTTRTVYYCADCIEKKGQQAQLKKARTANNKYMYAHNFR